MATKKFTIEQMQGMVNSYGSDQKIADAFGTTRQCIQQQRTALGIKPYRTTIDRRNKRVRQLRVANWLIRELAEKFKLSKRQIIRIIKEGGSEKGA